MPLAHADHYRTLGVGRHATPEEIKRAYRSQAKRLHPDLDPSPAAAERFMRIQAAYETLRDPLLRIAYDARFKQPEQRPTSQRPANRTTTSGTNAPEMKVRSWPFLGLHVTGLLFGVILVAGLFTGVAFGGWPWGAMFFTLPGIIVLPDAWRGIRMWATAKRRRP